MFLALWIAAGSRILPETSKLADAGIRVVAILVLALLVQRLLYLLVSRFERVMIRASHGHAGAEQRSRTVAGILRRLVTLLVLAIALLHVIETLGIDIRPLLAGAGLFGVIIGFGAQTLIRDMIAGVFIVAENQFNVGDLIEINGKPATVESLSLRSTVLRDFNGYLHFVPNGEMKVVTNRSRGWNRTAVDVLIPGGQNVDRALDACRRAADRMNAEPEWRDRLLDPIDVWGVESIAGADVQIRIVLRARPGAGGPEAARELRRRIQVALSDARIRVSVPPPPGPAVPSEPPPSSS